MKTIELIHGPLDGLNIRIEDNIFEIFMETTIHLFTDRGTSIPLSMPRRLAVYHYLFSRKYKFSHYRDENC